MEKFCIFCGQKPESKNREHVIPQWLIKLTGDPNREVYLGRKWTSPTLEKRQFSFSSFTFPSCKSCNEKSSDLERRAQIIVGKILSKSSLSAFEWDVFLDWLDKVRTGLWLGMIYLNKNYRGLLPMFHIDRRIGSKDRFVIIYEIIDDGLEGVGWSVTDTPLFEHMPSCCTITINNFLFSKRFGFPYPKLRYYRSEGGYWIEMNAGTENQEFPFIKKKFKLGGTQLFQPVISYGHFFEENGKNADLYDLYNTQYVRKNCLNFEKGKGKIFRRDRQKMVEYPQKPVLDWIPKQRFSRGEVSHQLGVIAGNFLEELFLDCPSYERLKPEEHKRHIDEREGVLRLHKTIMDHYIKQKSMYY